MLHANVTCRYGWIKSILVNTVVKMGLLNRKLDFLWICFVKIYLPHRLNCYELRFINSLPLL